MSSLVALVDLAQEALKNLPCPSSQSSSTSMEYPTTQSLVPLVDLAQEALKHLLFQPLALVHLRDHLPDFPYPLLLVGAVHLVELQLPIHLFHPCLQLPVLASVVLLQHRPLRRRCAQQCLVDQPAAFVVLNVRPDLSNRLRGSVGVQEVVLRLEVLPQRDEDLAGLREILGRGQLQVVQSKRDGQIEAVVGGLVDDDEGELVDAEIGQVDVVLGRRQQVARLADLSLEGDLVEELEQVDVRRVGAEVLLQQDVDGRFEHEGVVDGDHADARLPVPARLPAPRERGVHDVVRDEEEGLEELCHPPQGGGCVEGGRGEGGGRGEEGGSIEDGDAPVGFAAEGVVVERLENTVRQIAACERGGSIAMEREGWHAFWNHLRAGSGKLYCWACWESSSKREGHTDSNSLRVYGMLVLVRECG